MGKKVNLVIKNRQKGERMGTGRSLRPGGKTGRTGRGDGRTEGVLDEYRQGRGNGDFHQGKRRSFEKIRFRSKKKGRKEKRERKGHSLAKVDRGGKEKNPLAVRKRKPTGERPSGLWTTVRGSRHPRERGGKKV